MMISSSATLTKGISSLEGLKVLNVNILLNGTYPNVQKMSRHMTFSQEKAEKGDDKNKFFVFIQNYCH